MAKSYKSEDRIQQECYMWFWNTYPNYRRLLFHVPNGGARSASEGKLFKLIGVVSGVADLLLMVNGTTYCFELKNKYGVQSASQKAWEILVKREGFEYHLIRSLLDFQSIVKTIMDETN